MKPTWNERYAKYVSGQTGSWPLGAWWPIWALSFGWFWLAALAFTDTVEDAASQRINTLEARIFFWQGLFIAIVGFILWERDGFRRLLAKKDDEIHGLQRRSEVVAPSCSKSSATIEEAQAHMRGLIAQLRPWHLVVIEEDGWPIARLVYTDRGVRDLPGSDIAADPDTRFSTT